MKQDKTTKPKPFEVLKKQEEYLESIAAGHA
jgi:hypothetical protein